MITAAILVSAYAIIAFGRAPFLRLDRAGAAIVGALLMVLAGSISFEEAVDAVDVHTIVLLFGMTVIVAHLRPAAGSRRWRASCRRAPPILRRCSWRSYSPAACCLPSS